MTPLRLLQVSDLHTGRNEEPEIEAELHRIVAQLDPEVVVATGDLTHRNRADEHERARAFLRSLGPPLVVIPGNHDIPALPPQRLARTFAAYSRVWGETEPSYRSPRLVVLGLNSVRAWRYQRGSLRRGQLERVARELAGAPPGALRVVALHHHLSDAPWRDSKRTIPRRSPTLAALAEAGAELVLSGHIHQSSVHDRREVHAEIVRSAVLAVAPGLRRPRARRPAEVGGFHAVEADAEALRIVTYTWHEARFAVAAERRFPRRGFAATPGPPCAGGARLGL
jgi:3',5'-cyclic AMP phosphodiesterase CpdA